VAQTGYAKYDWPIGIWKVFTNNALDACEESGVAPEIAIGIDGDGIRVAKNGPGLPAEVPVAIGWPRQSLGGALLELLLPTRCDKCGSAAE